MRPLALCVSVYVYVCVCIHALCIAEGKGQEEGQLRGVGGARGGALVTLIVVVVAS